MHKLYDPNLNEKLRETTGREATFVWLFVGAGLLLFSEASPGLLSVPGIAFLLLGMFAAAIFIGGTTYLVKSTAFRGLRWVLENKGESAAAKLSIFAFLLVGFLDWTISIGGTYLGFLFIFS